MLYNKFRNGINLGGWFSQYDVNEPKPFTKEERSKHFKTFIVESNMRQIKEWGFDHVRLPVDGKIFFNREDKRLSEEIKEGITRCLDWCEKMNLNVILDLHDMEGNIYGEIKMPIPLLTDENKKTDFLIFWRQMTKWLLDRRTPEICFELFNEISDVTGYLWRSLYKEAIKEIRQIDENRPILVGSNNQNSIEFLKELDLVGDDKVFYNFHYYEPQIFTHQKADFSEEFREFHETITYPGDISGFKKYLEENPKWQSKHRLTAKEEINDHGLMVKLLKQAREFTKYSGCELYCGEYGVINSAPPVDAAKWMEDFNTIADEYGFGRALWNYKTLDFGLLDKDNRIVHEELVNLLIKQNQRTE